MRVSVRISEVWPASSQTPSEIPKDTREQLFLLGIPHKSDSAGGRRVKGEPLLKFFPGFSRHLQRLGSLAFDRQYFLGGASVEQPLLFLVHNKGDVSLAMERQERKNGSARTS